MNNYKARKFKKKKKRETKRLFWLVPEKMAFQRCEALNLTASMCGK